MKKLIELLLEYKPQRHCLDKPKGIYNKKYGIGWYKIEGNIGGWFSEGIIISKKFGFIKWLVDNNKIDTDYTYNLVKLEDRCYDGEGYYIESNYESYGDVDRTIMYLSISDTPIEDLISLLK